MQPLRRHQWPATHNPSPLPTRSAGLFDTLWPADHGDTARRKFVTEGGLPADLDPAAIELRENKDLPYAQWMYTRSKDEIYVYGMPKDLRGKPYFARVHAQTLHVQQKVVLPFILYMGGAVMHANGDVYLVHGPSLSRFEGGDLNRRQTVSLPKSNGLFTQYNGLTVTHDGMLVIKGWSMNSHEWPFFRQRLLPLLCGLLGLAAVIGAGLWAAGTSASMVLAVSGLLAALPSLLLLMACWRTGVSCRQFLFPQETGHLLLVDPVTLKVVQQLAPSERLAYGRMAIAPVGKAAELGQEPTTAEYLVIPGDEAIHRWRYENGRLHADPEWSQTYRQWGDGSFVGTGPAIWQQEAFYTNNTAPLLSGNSYQTYRKSLDGGRPQLAADLNDDEPGFMFWSIVVDPIRELVFCWDTAAQWVEARGAKDFKRKWKAPLFNTDCCVVQANHGHLYTTDHSEYLPPLDLLKSTNKNPKWPHIEKSLVVLDVETGAEKLRVPIGQGSPVMSMIIPGQNDDLFVSRRDALVRIVHTRCK